MEKFGELLRRLRTEQGYTLDEVAQKIGTHKGYISGIETGSVNPPSVKFIRKIARLLRVEEKDLVMRAWVEKAPEVIREEVRRKVFGPCGEQEHVTS